MSVMRNSSFKRTEMARWRKRWKGRWCSYSKIV